VRHFAAIVAFVYAGHYHAEAHRLTAEVADLTDECGELSSQLEQEARSSFETEERLQLATEDVESLRVAIAAMDAEVNEARAGRKPFNPSKATNLQLLAQIVAAECDSTAPYKECRAVDQVVLNRWAAEGKSDSLLPILTAPGQFSPVTSKAWLWATPGLLETAAAYNAYCAVDVPPVAQVVLYFCTVPSATSSEFFRTKLDRVTQIGSTVFFKEKGE